jgi:hypothetical protein
MPTLTISTPEKLVVSENGTAQTKPEETSSETSKLLRANATIVVWLIFLAIGGGLLALYYVRIGYLPDIEWKSALIYLFIGTVVGGAIGILLIMSLYIPGVLWSEFIIFDRRLEKHFSYDLKRNEPCMRSIINFLGEPFLLVLLISHMMLLVGRAYIYWALASVLLVVTFLLMRLRFEWVMTKGHGVEGKEPTNPNTNEVSNTTRTLKALWQQPKHSRETFKYSFWFTLSVLLSQVSIYVIYRLSGSVPISFRFVALTILCTAGVWISNHVVAFRHHHYPRQAIAASLVAAGLLLFTADHFSSLSVKLMNRFGIGYYQRVNMLVTDHGDKIVSSLGVPKCGDLQLCNVEILSKVGDQYFLRVGDLTYVTLPKSDVVAIRPLRKP